MKIRMSGESVKPSKKVRAGRRSLHAAGSVSASQLKPLIKDAEIWVNIYIDREANMRARGAHREAAHYEDLISAHQNIAQSLRKLVEGASNRQPTPNNSSSPATGQRVVRRLESEIRELKQELASETAWANTYHKTCERLNAQLNKYRKKDQSLLATLATQETPEVDAIRKTRSRKLPNRMVKMERAMKAALATIRNCAIGLEIRGPLEGAKRLHRIANELEVKTGLQNGKPSNAKADSQTPRQDA